MQQLKSEERSKVGFSLDIYLCTDELQRDVDIIQVREGKKPFYLKKSAQKEIGLEQKYTDIYVVLCGSKSAIRQIRGFEEKREIAQVHGKETSQEFK